MAEGAPEPVSPVVFTVAGAGQGLARALPLALARVGLLLGLKKYWAAMVLKKALIPFFTAPVRRFKPRRGLSVVDLLKLRHPAAVGRTRLLLHEFRRSGWTGTLAQVSLPLAVNVAAGAAMFTSFRFCLSYLTAHAPGAPPAWELQQHALPHLLAAGALSGVCQALIMCPVDQVRLSLLHRSQEDACFRAAFCDLLRAHGARHLFRGLPLALLRESLGVGAFFGAYEVARRAALAVLTAPTDAPTHLPPVPTTAEPYDTANVRRLEQRFAGLVAIVCGGAVAGVVYRVVTHPFENIAAFQHRRGEPLSLLRFLHAVPPSQWAPLLLRGLRASLRGVMTPAILGFVVLEVLD